MIELILVFNWDEQMNKIPIEWYFNDIITWQNFLLSHLVAGDSINWKVNIVTIMFMHILAALFHQLQIISLLIYHSSPLLEILFHYFFFPTKALWNGEEWKSLLISCHAFLGITSLESRYYVYIKAYDSIDFFFNWTAQFMINKFSKLFVNNTR